MDCHQGQWTETYSDGQRMIILNRHSYKMTFDEACELLHRWQLRYRGCQLMTQIGDLSEHVHFCFAEGDNGEEEA